MDKNKNNVSHFMHNWSRKQCVKHLNRRGIQKVLHVFEIRNRKIRRFCTLRLTVKSFDIHM